jgi:hypothetical protein
VKPGGVVTASAPDAANSSEEVSVERNMFVDAMVSMEVTVGNATVASCGALVHYI